MANPKRRHSPSRRDKRRANWRRVEKANVMTCPQCKEPKLPHQVCPNCGYYNGLEVIKIKVKKEKGKEKETDTKSKEKEK
jgi:large subunit ribosomal protein L32